MKKLLFFTVCLAFLTGQLRAQDGKFTFTLPAPINTSAGVFKDDSILVRTLWNNVKLPAGAHTRFWDGEDDYGVNIVNTSSQFAVKIVSSNVKYEWQGVLGNTSNAQVGSGVHKGYYHCMRGLVFTNGFGYFCKGYAEGYPSLAKFRISDPQTKIDFVNSPQPGDINYVATDDINVYWGAFDANASSSSFVFASKVSDDSDVMFSSGQTYAVRYGKTYTRAISISNLSDSRISGLAVQKTGPYLFVARSGLNELQVLNKTTGALVQTLIYKSPKSLCVDESNRLWMVTGTNTLSKYQVNTDGTLSNPVLTIAGLLKPAAVQVSEDGTMITVADDSTSQQVKFFNNETGALQYTLGTPKGYFADPDVNDSKFYFNDLRSDYLTFIAYQPDGSFWVGDPGNSRVQQYSSSRTFIRSIQSLGAAYNTGVDRNNITRVFSDNMEFKVDYATQQLSGSAGWKMVKNWGANIPAANYHKDPKFQTTLKNGRTYGLIRNDNHFEVVEYPATGSMRFTGTKLYELSKILCPDGSLQDCILTSSSCIINRYELLGFDSQNNPRWSTVPEMLAKTVVLSNGNPACFPRTPVLTSSNKVVFYNHKAWANNVGPVYSSGYHLGLINRGGSKWLFQTEKSTYVNYSGEFPPAGYFDVGNMVNDYAGGSANVVDRSIITSYHGEFWKNSQTNMFNHYWDNGLSVGQFGTTRPKTNGETSAMMAGNVLTPIIVKDANGDYYLYHGDEADHAGVHRWKITGINTITEEVVALAPPSTYVGPKGEVDLMAGLPFDTNMPDNTAGWTRYPSTNAVVDKYKNAFTAYTGRHKHDKHSSPDILINFVKTTAENYSVNRDLGTNNVVNSWKISGEVAYPFNMPNGNSINQYLEVLDANGKILTRFYPAINRMVTPGVASVYGNRMVITQGSEAYVKSATQELKPFEVKIVNGTVTFTYGNFAPVSGPIFDGTGNWRTPKTLRVMFVSTQSSLAVYQTIIDIKDFKFMEDFLPQPGINVPPSVNAGNDKAVIMPTSNSATLQGTATDVDGTIVSYAWTKLSGPTAGTVNGTTTATLVVNGLQNGVYVYQLKVTDDKGASSVDTAQIIVTTLNKAPVINAGADISITFPVLNTTLSGNATDADGSITSYQWTKISGPTNFVLAYPKSLSTDLTGLVPGIYYFELTVIDNDGAISKDTVKVTVNLSLLNKPPVVNAGGDKSMTLPTGSTTVTGVASDPDGTIKEYQWTKISGPSLGVIASPKAAQTILYNLASGVYKFELKATDNSYAVDRDTMMVTVNRGLVNMIPRVNAGPDKNVLLPNNTANIGGSGQDQDGTITFLWSKVSGPSSFYFDSATRPFTSVLNLVSGNYVFELKVTDNNGAVARDSINVKVYSSTSETVTVNQAPQVNAGMNQVIYLPANSVTLQGSASDADGSISKYAWTKTYGPATFTFGSPGSPTTSVSNLLQGTYDFELAVTDNSGAVSKDFVQVIVNASQTVTKINLVPVVNAGSDKSITLPTNTVTLAGYAADTDGTIASYNWSWESGGGTYSIASPSSATTQIGNLQVGTYYFKLTAQDNSGAVVSDIIKIVVNPVPVVVVNQVPVANAGPDLVVYLPATSVTLRGTGTDVDGTIAQYSWTRSSGLTYTFSSPSSATTTLSNLVEGSYSFQFKVVDNSGASAYDWVNVTVKKAAVAASTSTRQILGIEPATTFTNDFTVYPNPVTDFANLDISSITASGKVAVSVVNAAGTQVISKQSQLTGNKTTYRLDMSNLATGVYVVILRFEDGSLINRKVVKGVSR